MFNKKFLILLLALCCVLFAALFFNRDANRYQTDYSGELFLPQLKAQLPDVAKIQIESVSETVEIENQDDQWVVVTKKNYPADANIIRRLIYSLAELNIVEAKTDDESLLSKIGLTQGSEDSVRIRLADASDKTISDILFGISQASVSGQGQAWFVRHLENNQSWLVSGQMQLNRSAYQWLNKTVLSLEPEEIQQVVLNSGAQDRLVVNKLDESQLFELEGLSDDEQVAEYKLDILVESAAEIQLDDVRLAASRASEIDGAASVQLETTSGLTVDIRIIDPQQGWIRLSADTETDDPAVSGQSQALNKNWSGWEFKIPDYKLETLMQNKQALLGETQSS